MAGWLLKTEPSAYSLRDLKRDGQTVWDGVSNALALKHLRQIRAGDRLLIYHTGQEKAVVGTARATSDPYPAPDDDSQRSCVVDVAYVGALPQPVPLAVIKASTRLRTWELVRLPRLSVLPVSSAQWAEVERLAR